MTIESYLTATGLDGRTVRLRFREVSYLKGIAEGNLYTEVALENETIKMRVRRTMIRLRRKLGLANDSAVIIWALKQGIINLKGLHPSYKSYWKRMYNLQHFHENFEVKLSLRLGFRGLILHLTLFPIGYYFTWY